MSFFNLKYNFGGLNEFNSNNFDSNIFGISGQEQLDPNYWSIGSFLRRNPSKKIQISLQKNYNNYRTTVDNTIKEYLNLFFGPTGPGINYGGTGSYSTIYNNINGISLTNNKILDDARLLYSAVNLSGITQQNYVNNITKSRVTSIFSTPPINRIT